MTLIQIVIRGLLADYGVRFVLFELYDQSVKANPDDKFTSEEEFWTAISLIKEKKVVLCHDK